MKTTKEWQRCRAADESSRDEIIFDVHVISPTRHRIRMRHPRCGYEVSFAESPATWRDIEATIAAHLPDRDDA